MKSHLTLLSAAVFAALSLPSCVSFDDDDDDVRPVTTTTVTEESRSGYAYGYATPSAGTTVAVAPRSTYRTPASVTVTPPTTTTRTTRTTYLRPD